MGLLKHQTNKRSDRIGGERGIDVGDEPQAEGPKDRPPPQADQGPECIGYQLD